MTQHPQPQAWLRRPRRIDKYLADATGWPRAQTLEALEAGRVQLQTQEPLEPWTLVDPARDTVHLDGRPLALRPPSRYALLHKPVGYLSAMSDPHGRPCLADVLPAAWSQHSGHVGRLDKATTGALLLTDDGDLNWLLSAPGEHVWKRYLITLKQPVQADDPRLDTLRGGLHQGGQALLPARVRLRAPRQLLIWLQEGRNRQVRRMVKQVGMTLETLHREAIGDLELGPLPCGALRPLTAAEVHRLYQGDRGLARLEQRTQIALKQRLVAGDLSDRESTRIHDYLSAHA
jgi:pseudouridine synthase